MLWQLRPSLPTDEGFVYSSWLKSYRDAPAMSGISNTIYYANVHGIIENVLKTAKVIVACNDEDPQLIYGYIVYEPGTVFYGYTKHSFRGLGIAKSLEKAALGESPGATVYTCKTRVSDSLMKSRPYYLYEPFSFFRK